MGAAIGVHRIDRVNSWSDGLSGTVLAVAAIGDVTRDGSPDVMAVTYDPIPATSDARISFYAVHRRHSSPASALPLHSMVFKNALQYDAYAGGLVLLGGGWATREAVASGTDGTAQAPIDGIPPDPTSSSSSFIAPPLLAECSVVAYGCTSCDALRGSIGLFWVEKATEPAVVAVAVLAGGTSRTIGGAAVPANEGIGTALSSVDVDGDGVRDLIASTAQGRLLVVFLAAGGVTSAGVTSAGATPGAMIREAVWVSGMGTVPAGCRWGSQL